jgi:hypothetical protein
MNIQASLKGTPVVPVIVITTFPPLTTVVVEGVIESIVGDAIADAGTATTRINNTTIAQIRDIDLTLTKLCMRTGPEIFFIFILSLGIEHDKHFQLMHIGKN